MDPSLFMNGTDGVWGSNDCTSSTLKSYVPCILGTMTIVTLCGNLLVITSIVYFRQLQTPTNYLVLSLAAADLLVGAVVIPFSIVLFVNTCWQFHFKLCIIRGVFDITLCTSSILNLCCISVDRYIAVHDPLRYRNKITAETTAAMTVVVWTASTVCGVVVTFGEQKQNRCVFVKSLKLSMVVPLIGFCIPVIVILTVYVKIFHVAEKHARRIESQNAGEGNSKMERKATNTLMIVIGVFIMCWMPFILCITTMPFVNYVLPLVLIEVFKWLGWSNSMMNPFIYGVFYKWFRSAFKIILTGKIFNGDYANAKL